MTIKVSESFSATGAEFSIDLEKLKKLIDKNAITVLAKVQENFPILRVFLGNIHQLVSIFCQLIEFFNCKTFGPNSVWPMPHGALKRRRSSEPKIEN